MSIAGNIVERVRQAVGLGCRRQVAALPWRRVGGSLEVMLITSRDTGRWVLPKGWPEEGEHTWAAAAREAEEEAGLSGVISSSEAGRYRYGKVRRSGETIDCEVLVYPLQVDRVAEVWPERKQRRRRWFAPADAARAVAEPDLRDLLNAFGAAPPSPPPGSDLQPQAAR